MAGFAPIPHWLDVLLKEDFFAPCLLHRPYRKNEKNIYCLDCCMSLCPHCLCPHRTHRMLQVRRYVYQDVLRLKDADKLMDCSLVQSYISNGDKVVFLNKRPITRLLKSAINNYCITCRRSVQHPFLFCCLSCKVQHIDSTQRSIQSYLSNHHHQQISEDSFSELEDCIINAESALDSVNSVPTSSASTVSNGPSSPPFRTTTATATSLSSLFSAISASGFVRKKRSNLSSTSRFHNYLLKSPPVAEVMEEDAAAQVADVGLNRRKGVPYRAPLY